MRAGCRLRAGEAEQRSLTERNDSAQNGRVSGSNGNVCKRIKYKKSKSTRKRCECLCMCVCAYRGNVNEQAQCSRTMEEGGLGVDRAHWASINIRQMGCRNSLVRMNWKAGSGTERDVRSDPTPSETLACLRYLAWGWDLVKNKKRAFLPARRLPRDA